MSPLDSPWWTWWISGIAIGWIVHRIRHLHR